MAARITASTIPSTMPMIIAKHRELDRQHDPS